MRDVRSAQVRARVPLAAGQIAPEGTAFVQAALNHPHFDNDVGKLIRMIVADLRLRGLGKNRRVTFAARLPAIALLLDATKRGLVDATTWHAKRCDVMPERPWSAEQRDVLEVVAAGLSHADANARVSARALFVSGGPGTGTTEVVRQCALNASSDGARVLIACPIGPLVAACRKRIPPKSNIVVETQHSAFRSTRAADAVYIPPGRLRTFDLIVFDEVSQQGARVWGKIRSALAELTPGPFVVFVGDFQQLQPIDGENDLQAALDRNVGGGGLRRIDIQQHAAARCTDELMLNFLRYIRTHPPSRALLRNFLLRRQLPKDLDRATRAAMALERSRGKSLTFLTVTNRGAALLNASRVRHQFSEVQDLMETRGVPPDPAAGLEKIVIRPGMLIRPTKNLGTGAS